MVYVGISFDVYEKWNGLEWNGNLDQCSNFLVGWSFVGV